MFNIKDILEATGGKLLQGGAEIRFCSASTDTRTIKQGALFIAIKGSNFDGHDFIEKAISKGAIGAVVSSDISPHLNSLPKGEMKQNLKSSPLKGEGKGEGFVIIRVKDTVKAMGDIARSHRRKFDIPIIAITGSNGKTTTKEMSASILSVKYNILKNEGTENNFIGVPLTLLRLDSHYEIAVLELGSNHPGEIARLSEIVQPGCGVVVNAGLSHLEFFNTLDNVREEKLSLLKRLGSDSVSIVNGDDAQLVKEAKTMCAEVVTFGLGAGCDFRAADIKEAAGGIDFTLNSGNKFHLNLLGRHNIYNALASAAAGSLYGVSEKEAAAVLKDFKLPKLRMEFIEEGGIKFIFDCYNSNPSSMAGALETIKGMDASGRKIVVAGDMLELGQAAPGLHKKIGGLAAAAGVDILMGVGPLSGFILEGAQEEGIGGKSLFHFENSVAAAKALKDILREGDLVLVKGSRGIKMEEIKKCFTTSYTR